MEESTVSIEEKAEDIEKRAEEASVIKLVDQILQEAIQQRATDIHIEPDRDELAVRYRVDGILYDTRVSPDIKYLYASIISRIKIMARLDIAERRFPRMGASRSSWGPGSWISASPFSHRSTESILSFVSCPLKCFSAWSAWGFSLRIWK